MRKILITTAIIGLIFTACKDKEDPCKVVRKEAGKKQDQFELYRDSTFNYWLPEAMKIPGYKDVYDLYLPRDGSLKAAITTANHLEHLLGNATPAQAAAVRGAGRTAGQAITWQEALEAYKKENTTCF